MKAKKFDIKLIIMMVLMLLAASLLASCGLVYVPLKSISFNESGGVDIFVGQSYKLAPVMTPSNAKYELTYSSSDTSIVSVSSVGLVKGLKAGTATVTVSAAKTNVSATIQIRVGYDRLRSAKLTGTNCVQYFNEITSHRPVTATVSINGPDYTDGNFTYEWFYYSGEAVRGYLTKAETDAFEVPDDISPIAKTAAVETFVFPEKNYIFNKIIVRVTEKDAAEPVSVWTNVLTFGIYSEMSEVQIEIPADIEGNFLPETNFENSTSLEFPAIAQHGATVHIEASWHANANEDPEIRWGYLYKAAIDDPWGPQHNILGQNGKKLSFFVDKMGFYEITAQVDGIGSLNYIRFSTRAADVAEVELAASAGGVNLSTSTPILQQSSEPFEVTFTVSWNSAYSGTDKPIEWYVNDVLRPGQTGTEFKFTPPSGTVADYTVKAVVKNSAADPSGIAATALIRVLAHYNAIERLTLTPDDTAKLEQFQRDTPYAASTITATLSPDANINPLAQITWYVNGEVKQTSPAKTYTFTPVGTDHGEFEVYAVVDNVKSNSLTYCLVNNNEHNEILRARIAAKFVWNGVVSNHWITTDEEFITLVGYVLATRSETRNISFGGSLYNIHIPARETEFDALKRAALDYYDESGSYIITMSPAGDTIACAPETINFPVGPSASYDSTAAGAETTLAQIRMANASYGTVYDADRTLFIDDTSLPVYPENLTSSNMLYKVVSWGYRPAFASDAAGTALAALYEEARTVLKTIVTDGMTAYQKTLAIYDWIIEETEYDWDLSRVGIHYPATEHWQDSTDDWDTGKLGPLSNYTAFTEWLVANTAPNAEADLNEYITSGTIPASAETRQNIAKFYDRQRLKYSMQFSGFYLEGVFNDGLAVCDGRSKAFTLLCAMEGITSVRVIGEGGGRRHAWNKVLIDIDPSDYTPVMKWYLVDTTWDDVKLSREGVDSEYLLHSNFLISDDEAAQSEDDLGYPEAETSSELFYYQQHLFSTGGYTYSIYITEQAAIYGAVAFLKAKAIELGEPVYMEVYFYAPLDINTMVSSALSAASASGTGFVVTGTRICILYITG
ncbi:MAG TPA: Ig-like domain-containing protein [Clostridia bacterium]|nr:Ig-like domain-containing protein [Clostridia bacterium]